MLTYLIMFFRQLQSIAKQINPYPHKTLTMNNFTISEHLTCNTMSFKTMKNVVCIIVLQFKTAQCKVCVMSPQVGGIYTKTLNKRVK